MVVEFEVKKQDNSGSEVVECAVPIKSWWAGGRGPLDGRQAKAAPQSGHGGS